MRKCQCIKLRPSLIGLDLISFSSSLLPLAAGMLMFRRLTKTVAFFYMYIVVAVCVDVLLVIQSSRGMNNHYLANIFSLVEVSMLMVFFSRSLTERSQKAAFLITIPLFAGIWIYYLFSEGLWSLNPHIFLVKNTLLIVATLFVIYLSLRQDEVGGIINNALFWIYAGIFVYGLSTVAVYGLVNELLSGENKNVFMYSSYIANITSNTLYAIGFLCPVLMRK